MYNLFESKTSGVSKAVSGSKNQSADEYLQQLQIAELYQQQKKKTSSAAKGAAAGAVARKVFGPKKSKQKKTNEDFMFESYLFESTNIVDERKMQNFVIKNFYNNSYWNDFMSNGESDLQNNPLSQLILYVEFLCLDYLDNNLNLDIEGIDWIEENFSLDRYFDILQKVMTRQNFNKYGEIE